MTEPHLRPGNSPISVLVVGDWVVDEYWTLVGHDSDRQWAPPLQMLPEEEKTQRGQAEERDRQEM